MTETIQQPHPSLSQLKKSVSASSLTGNSSNPTNPNSKNVRLGSSISRIASADKLKDTPNSPANFKPLTEEQKILYKKVFVTINSENLNEKGHVSVDRSFKGRVQKDKLKRYFPGLSENDWDKIL